MKKLFVALLVSGGMVMLMGQTWPFVGYPPAAGTTATPQVTMNPFAMVAGQNNPIDMGPTPMANFVSMVDWNQEPVPTTTGNYCGTTTAPNCVLYKYIDHARNSCLTPQTVLVLSPGAGLPATQAPGPGGSPGAETWFQHFYPGNPTPSPAASPLRLVGSAFGASCASYYAAPTPTPDPFGTPISSHPFMMNVDDSGYQTFLSQNVWTNTGSNYYPQTQNATTAPMNVYEDTSGMMGNGITGGGSGQAQFSTEYGCGFNGGNTCRIDQQGTGTATAGPYALADPYTTALGKWANSACGSPCLKITLNGTSPDANTLVACNIFNGTVSPNKHCHDRTITGDVDNTLNTVWDSVLVANTAHNIKDLDNESPIYDHLTANNFGSPTQLTMILNTWINFQQDANTTGVTVSDLEPGWGQGTPGPGQGKAGDLATNVRLLSIAMEWLAPDYSGTKSSNDRIIPRRLPIGLTATEAPSFFELFLVPFAPFQSEPLFVHNLLGNVTVGNGCPASSGDVGGALAIKVACTSTDNGAVERLEYNQVWFNGHNYGPMAVLVNTSAKDTVTIQSSWFQLQPESSYHFALSLAAGEMQSVAQGNIGGGVANFTTCTNVTYCLSGNNTMALNTTSTIPTTIGPDSAVILVTTNS